MNNPPKILVADDSPVDALLISRLLQREGYLVLSAENGIAAYDLAVSQQPDLILLDIMMPGQDGYAVCQLLKQNTTTSDIPVIFVTAKSETTDKVKGLNVGGIDYIAKPFRPAEVMARVQTHLRLKATYEENLEYHKALLQAQKMASITTLADGTAHNINNLMGTVIGYTDLLRENLSHEDNAYKYTDKVLEASQRAADLARDLLTYANAVHSTASSVDMRELFQRMIRLYGDKKLDSIRLDLHIPQDIPKIEADEDQILQALSNIFVNSREAIPDGGTIAISVGMGPLPPNVHCNGSEFVTDDYLIISISDDGAGMSEETVKRIFEPFFTTKKTVGVGLGLSAACGIIQKHKGAISVETKPGAGSTFRVYLPAST